MNTINKTIYMRYPGGCTKAFTMSFDDGRVKDAPIIDVLKANGIKATFFINTGNFGKSYMLMADEQAAIEQYGQTGMEIASHTRTHPDLPTVLEQCGEAGLKEEILDDIVKLEEMFDIKVQGMSYPGAPPYKLYNDAVVEFLKQNGIGYARTLHAKQPTFDMPENWHIWQPTIWIGNVSEIAELTKEFLSAKVCTKPLLYNIWGHAYDIDDKWDSFEAFEQFCETIGTQDDVWYASYGDIYCYVQSFKKLECQTDAITNNSDVTLWFESDGKLFEIKAGQTIKI